MGYTKAVRDMNRWMFDKYVLHFKSSEFPLVDYVFREGKVVTKGANAGLSYGLFVFEEGTDDLYEELSLSCFEVTEHKKKPRI